MIERGSVVKGPCIIKWMKKIIRTAGDVQLNMGLDTFEIPSSEFGRIDQRRNNVPITVKFTPVGEIQADLIPIYWPHLSLPIGASLFGPTDEILEIIPITGKEVITLKACAITGMPNIIISATKTTLGEVTFTSLLIYRQTNFVM